MDDRLYEAVKDRWVELAKFLANAAAILRAGRRTTAEWRTLTVPDIVAETFKRALDKRTWNETRYPDVRDYLVSVAESIISEPTRNQSSQAEKTASRDTEIAEIRSDQEEEAAAKELKAVVGAALMRDSAPELMRQIVECFEAGITKPSEIADMLEKPQAEIDIALRRFKRRAREALKEHTK